jgi:hypothetical protein
MIVAWSRPLTCSDIGHQAACPTARGSRRSVPKYLTTWLGMECRAMVRNRQAAYG